MTTNALIAMDHASIDFAHSQSPLASGPAYALIVTNGMSREVDQIVSTPLEANRERKDLISMDCGKVTIKRFDSWADAHAYEDKLRGY
ncbi:hypothetical protein [Novosphingobium sp.]|uniref:hypothetical protein n=1 Tax=Novosphingobium sp. TaxID=1874826 RepID=UPI003B518804